MKKVIETALSFGHIVTIKKDDEFTSIKIETTGGHFKSSGVDYLNCCFFPEDEKFECTKCISDLILGLY